MNQAQRDQPEHIVANDPRLVSQVINQQTRCFLLAGDCRRLLDATPPESVQLIVTSPPYNIGKEYEEGKTLKEYLDLQAQVITKSVRVLNPRGSLCWQVGNHIVSKGEILPLDIALYPLFQKHGLKLRNRIVWHFEHGLHCQSRFSGRYEVLLWFTKTDNYMFNLDAVRVPQKYPGKRYFKGPKVGELSGNPLGKNPSDVWIFPNVKNNHVEKTDHPCQYPIELVDRMVLSTTRPGDIVMDPFAGASTTLVAALLRGRRALGAEIVPEYQEISEERIAKTLAGKLRVRPTGTPVYQPTNDTIARLPLEFATARQQYASSAHL